MAVALVFAGSAGVCRAASGGQLLNPDRYRSLAADHRAQQEGDTLTVLVVESAQASSRAGTGSSSAWDIRVEGEDGAGRRRVGAGLDSNSEGLGGTSRSGALQAQLTVTVVSVESNGMLRVSGEQNLVVNGERQRIRLSGRVRPEDIDQGNRLPSNRIADAEIEFTGQGVVSESQRRNIFQRVLGWLGVL
jgi:flagellar L-ring protein precursor FlgH